MGAPALDMIKNPKSVVFFFFKSTFNESIYTKCSAEKKKPHEKFKIHIRLKGICSIDRKKRRHITRASCLRKSSVKSMKHNVN